MMTIDKMQYLLRELRMTLPETTTLNIYNKCDNPDATSDYGKLRALLSGQAISMTMRCDKLQELIDETNLEWDARRQITPLRNAGETIFNLTSRCKDFAEDRQETYYQDALLMGCEQL